MGSDDWNTREDTQARLSNLACSLFLPRTNSDPEIQNRLNQIHRRFDRYQSAKYYEDVIRHVDYWRWFDLYIVNGEYDEKRFGDVFEFLRGEWKEAREHRSGFMLRYPVVETSWLFGPIFPGEYVKFCQHVAKFNKKMKVAAKIGEAFLPSYLGIR